MLHYVQIALTYTLVSGPWLKEDLASIKSLRSLNLFRCNVAVGTGEELGKIIPGISIYGDGWSVSPVNP